MVLPKKISIKIVAVWADLTWQNNVCWVSKRCFSIKNKYHLGVWKIDAGGFLDLPDIHTKFPKNSPAVSEEFGNKHRDTRILTLIKRTTCHHGILTSFISSVYLIPSKFLFFRFCVIYIKTNYNWYKLNSFRRLMFLNQL